MLSPAYNPTDRPVVIDDDGRILGGREWGAVDPDLDLIAAAVAGGDLVVHDELPKGADPEVVAAVDAARGVTAPADAGVDVAQAAPVTTAPDPSAEPATTGTKPRSAR